MKKSKLYSIKNYSKIIKWETSIYQNLNFNNFKKNMKYEKKTNKNIFQ